MAAGFRTIDEAGADAPWLVMVHGLSQDHRVFSAQVAAFRARHRLLLIDLPGHGLSAAIPGPFGHAELATQVGAALDAAGVARCDYWGTHTGTAVGLLLAVAQPARFRSLILEGAVLPGRAMPEVAAEVDRACRIARADGVDAAVRCWFDEARWFDVMRRHPVACRAAAHRSIVADFSGAPWLFEGPAAPVPDVEPVLPELDIPVLLYNGAFDLPDFVDTADRLARLLPAVTRMTVPEAGGFPAWEYPDRVNAMAGAFLARLSAAAAPS